MNNQPNFESDNPISNGKYYHGYYYYPQFFDNSVNKYYHHLPYYNHYYDNSNSFYDNRTPGFDFSVNYTYQEKQIFDLVISSFLIGLQCLTINGFMVIKLFDTYSPSTKALINLVGSAFKDYSIYKPATSRPCNSERYFIGRNYLGLNTSIIDILHTFHIKVKFDLYPYTTLDSDELGFINSISDEYEKSQIDCIDQAKEFALNTHLYENVYEKHYQASLNFCSTFKIPIKTKNIQKLTWDFENHH